MHLFSHCYSIFQQLHFIHCSVLTVELRILVGERHIHDA